MACMTHMGESCHARDYPAIYLPDDIVVWGVDALDPATACLSHHAVVHKIDDVDVQRGFQKRREFPDQEIQSKT